MSKNLLADHLRAFGRLVNARFKALEKLVDERDRLYTTRFDSSETAVNTALASQKENTNNAFLASEKAIVKAEEAQKSYNQSHNDLSRKMEDQYKEMMPRHEIMQLLKAMDEKATLERTNADTRYANTVRDINSLRESRSHGSGQDEVRDETRRESRTQVNWLIGIAIAILFGLGGFIFSVLSYFKR